MRTLRFHPIAAAALAGMLLLASAPARGQVGTATPATPAQPETAATPAEPVAPRGGTGAATGGIDDAKEKIDAAQEKIDAAKRKAALTLTKALVEELEAAVEYQSAQAQRIEARGALAAAQRAEIERARERATDHVRVQTARVVKAKDELLAGTAGVEEVAEEIEALDRIADEGSESIAAVLTYDDRTEETLQEIAACIEAISDMAEDAVEEIEEASENGGLSLEVRVSGENGAVHIRAGGADRVSYGNAVEVKIDETVNDAVAFGHGVTVNGRVLGSAVSFGGDVRVGKTGHVEGDAAAFGGRVLVDDGGTVEGERLSFGPGAILSTFRSAPDVEVPWPTRLGGNLLTAGAQFLCFFLLGLVVLAIAPRRAEVVAGALAAHPLKAGGFGVLAAVLWLPITVLLAVTVIGIVLIPFFWLAYPVFGFFGYVALALVVGRKLPTQVEPTNTAVLAIGAAVIVVVGLIPVLGWLTWILAGFFAVGATLMTRFGEDRPDAPGPASNELSSTV